MLDNGSFLCKAGFAGDDTPCALVRTIVGRDKYRSSMVDQKDGYYVGSDAQLKRDILALSCPIPRGAVTHWDDMQKIWHYTFHKELRIDPRRQPILLTEAPNNSRCHKENMAEIMLESFAFPAMQIALPAVLSLIASGRVTGITLDCGDGISHTACIYEGYILTHATQKMEVAGCDLTDYMMQILNERGHQLYRSTDREAMRDIKEKLCYVALDYDEEMSKASTEIESTYKLPDGNTITVDSERFRCPEALFHPGLMGLETAGIHETIFNSINMCEIDVRRSLYGNIILSGGSTMFRGIGERITKELTNLAPSSVNIRVIVVPERKKSAWIGGSIVASLDFFRDGWISRKEYEEYGPSIVHKRCYEAPRL